MTEQQEPIDTADLLALANGLIAGHEAAFDGLEATTVRQKGDLLIFSGDAFLDEQGLPTARSTQVFNVFKFLTVTLSPRYRLSDAHPH